MLQALRGRQVRLLAAGGALGLALIVLSHFLAPRAEAPSAGGPGAAPSPPGGLPSGSLAQYEGYLSQRLASLLARVDGAGRVEVLVRLAAGEEAVYLQDRDHTTRRTTERDTQGGTRTIEEETQQARTVLAEGGRGTGQPVPRLLQGAQVEGIVVVAEGARDPAVRLRLLRAVQALFPRLPPHRIEILPGR